MNFQANTKDSLLAQLDILSDQYRDVIKNTSLDQLNLQQDGKWSIYQNIEHINKSNRVTTIGYKTPLALLRMFFGISSSGSADTEEIIRRYQKKLTEGAKSPILFEAGKSILKSNQFLLEKFEKQTKSLKNSIAPWSEKELEKIRLPHPILGKITGKEMLSFTTYHMFHHMNTIQRLL